MKRFNVVFDVNVSAERESEAVTKAYDFLVRDKDIVGKVSQLCVNCDHTVEQHNSTYIFSTRKTCQISKCPCFNLKLGN